MLLSSLERPGYFELWSVPGVLYIIREDGSIVNEETGEPHCFPGDYLVAPCPRYGGGGVPLYGPHSPPADPG